MPDCRAVFCPDLSIKSWNKLTPKERRNYWHHEIRLEGKTCGRCGKTNNLSRWSPSGMRLPPGEDKIEILCRSCLAYANHPRPERGPGRPKGSLNKKTLAKLKAMTEYERMCLDAERSI